MERKFKLIPRGYVALRAEFARIILGVLHEAREPLTTQLIIRMVVEARGVKTADQAIIATVPAPVNETP